MTFTRLLSVALKSCKGQSRFLSTCKPLSVTKKTLTIDNMNPNVKEMEFAVRGPIVIRGGQLEKDLEKVLFFNSVSAVNLAAASFLRFWCFH